jgi:hypothetical protein
MVNTNTVHQPPSDLNGDAKRIWDEEVRAMRDLLASLPPPPSLEEMARAQGVRIPQHWDDLPQWPEDDMEAWDGFDEILAEHRRSQRELAQQKLHEEPDIP